jgi:hypothetical protein
MYTCNVYIVYHFYFPEAFLQVKKLMEKTYCETEQNMSEKQEKARLCCTCQWSSKIMWWIGRTSF